MFKAGQLIVGKFALSDLEKFMWSIFIQTATSYTQYKYFKKLIKDQQAAMQLQLHSQLQANLQLCCRPYTLCTEFPQLWDVEKFMWSIFIQTATSYTQYKYFKKLIKDQQAAMQLQLHSQLQANLQLCCRPYTLCTEFPQLWDVEKFMWSIFIQTATSYTQYKYFKKLIKDQQAAMQLCMYKAAQLIIRQICSSAVGRTRCVQSSHSCGMQRNSCGAFSSKRLLRTPSTSILKN